jgi:2-amino-4-hydroxy-6-hydroxymethyldihydropteridine diphosphokinase
MYQVFLGLGSNLGDRVGYLSRAVNEIQAIAVIGARSSVYETEPVGMSSEKLFYNMVISVETEDVPVALLKKLKQIEKTIGRKHSGHLMDREIDIDILLYRGWSYEDAVVRIPHPEFEHRRFVLEPLNEIAPTALHPVLGQTVASLLRRCKDQSRVTRTDHVLTNAD